MLKNILLQFIELYNMTYAYYRIEDKLSVYMKTKTPSCIPKKKKKFAFAFEHLWLDLEFLNLFFPLKSHHSWSTAQLSKMLCNNVALTAQRFECNVLSPEFLRTVSSLNLLKTLSLFRECLGFSSMIFKP